MRELSKRKRDAPVTSDQEDVEARLREEMKKLAEGSPEEPTPRPAPQVEEPAANSAEPEASAPIQNENQLYTPGSEVQGKYTIQLYANQSKAAAQDFADAFIVKGYDVIINEAEIPGKGNMVSRQRWSFRLHRRGQEVSAKRKIAFSRRRLFDSEIIVLKVCPSHILIILGPGKTGPFFCKSYAIGG